MDRRGGAAPLQLWSIENASERHTFWNFSHHLTSNRWCLGIYLTMCLFRSKSWTGKPPCPPPQFPGLWNLYGVGIGGFLHTQTDLQHFKIFIATLFVLLNGVQWCPSVPSLTPWGRRNRAEGTGHSRRGSRGGGGGAGAGAHPWDGVSPFKKHHSVFIYFIYFIYWCTTTSTVLWLFLLRWLWNMSEVTIAGSGRRIWIAEWEWDTWLWVPLLPSGAAHIYSPLQVTL